MMDLENPRRTELVARLADHVLRAGLGASSLRPLAAAAGTSDRMLLYYFPDKAGLIAAVLGAVANRMTALLEAHPGAAPLARAPLEAKLISFVLDDAVWPYMQLWLEIAGLAARGDPVCAQVGGAIAHGFLAWTHSQLCTPSDPERQRDATRVLMAVEGAVLLKSLGLARQVAEATCQLD